MLFRSVERDGAHVQIVVDARVAILAARIAAHGQARQGRRRDVDSGRAGPPLRGGGGGREHCGGGQAAPDGKEAVGFAHDRPFSSKTLRRATLGRYVKDLVLAHRRQWNWRFVDGRAAFLRLTPFFSSPSNSSIVSWAGLAKDL